MMNSTLQPTLRLIRNEESKRYFGTDHKLEAAKIESSIAAPFGVAMKWA